jgi:GNAT superfamily N-acetyltransferase
MGPSDSNLEEAGLTRGELADAEALVGEAGWNQVAADWSIFLDLGTVHAVRNEAGRVIATAATLPYGGRFAWISMVLVAPDYRRRGLARRLLSRCVRDIAGAGLVPILDATPAGRRVYVGLGFEDAWSYHRLARSSRKGMTEPVPPDGIRIVPIDDNVFSELRRYDAAVFGADRGAVLARLRGRVPGADLVALRGDKVCGLLLGRDGRSATQLGPLVADDPAIAQSLLACALAANAGTVYIDLLDSHAETRAWLESQGFAPQRPLTRMLHGRSSDFSDVARTFAVAGPELG